MMNILLNPDPTVRSTPLLSLLSLSPFVREGYTNYVDGTIVEPVFEPVIFDIRGKIKSDFTMAINYIKSFQSDMVFQSYPQLIFQVIDMFYRVRNDMITEIDKHLYFVINVCVMLVLKSEGLSHDYDSYIFKQLLSGIEYRPLEEKMVMILSGILTRDLVCRLLGPAHYSAFVD